MTTQNVDKIYDGNGNQFNIQIDIDRVNNLQTTLNGKAASSHNHDASNITSGTFPTARIADDAITAAKVKDNETLPCNISGTAKYSRIMNPTSTDTIWGNNSYSGSGSGQHTIIGTLTITTDTMTSGSTTYEASWTNVHENFMFQSRHSGDGIISVYICMPGNTNGGTTNPACVIRCFSAQTSGISNPVKCYLKKGASGTHYTYTFTLITSVSDFNNCRCFGRLNHPGDSAFTFKTSGNIITTAQLTEETYGTILATCQYNRVGYADGWTTTRNFAIADSTSAHTGATSSVNGGANVTLKLPSTITASLVGDVTGNCSGSSGSCTGNSATATKATQDESGNNIKASYASSLATSGNNILLKNKNGSTLSTITAPYAASSDYLRYQHKNEINFKNVPSGDHNVWFNYRNGDTDGFDSTSQITDYHFGNKNKSTDGITLHASSFTGNASTATSAGKWTTARNIWIADSDSTNTGAAVSVDGSANATLKLPSTIKASITGNCSGSAGSVAWSGVTSKPDTFLKVSRGIAGCSSAFVDITTGTLNGNDIVYLFDTNDGCGNSDAKIEINVVNLEGSRDHTLVCVNSTTLRFRNTSSSLDYWLKRNDNGATKVPKNNNYVDVNLEPGMVIHLSRYGTTIFCHSNAEWAQNTYHVAAHPDGLVDGREYNVAFVNAGSSPSTQWSCWVRYDTDSLKYVPSTNTLKVTNLEGTATRAIQDCLAHDLHTYYGHTIDITNTKTLQLKNAADEVINAIDLPYVPVVFDQLGSAEGVIYCL